eukprot:TRINITY_DN6994_c0_g1_i1.p1 TRINITY_DN6994_c0_g1~~TRINITY_DN6994_c0_g1_i1.p1  ORF type:complete len:430 (+),score=98.44 TRINITY_DN6994_c0_g1_i1:38-1327(+)
MADDVANCDDQGMHLEQEDERGPPLACIFVANIGNDTTEDAVRNIFAQYGDILKMRLLKDRSSRPYAFIQYRTINSANQALVLGCKQTLDGKRLRTERAKVNRTLFFAKMPQSVTQQQLRDMMSQYGEVEHVAIIKNHQTNKSKGCGFVKFVYREDAMEAFTSVKNDQKLHWVVEWSTNANDSSERAVDRCNLFVGGLSPALVTKELVEEKFKPYGNLESVTLINPAEMENAGSVTSSKSAYAFVRFSDPQSALRAMEREHDREWLDKRKIRVQYCETQEQKSRRKSTTFLPALAPPSLVDPMPPVLLDDINLFWQLSGMQMYNVPTHPPYRKQKDPMLGGGFPPAYLPNYSMLNAPLINPHPTGPQWIYQQQLQRFPRLSPQVLPQTCSVQHNGLPYEQTPGSHLAAQFGGLSLHGHAAAQQTPFQLW